MTLSYHVDIEQEDDGRFLAEVTNLPGVMAYGPSAEAALAHVQALALRVLADRLEHDEGPRADPSVFTSRPRPPHEPSSLVFHKGLARLRRAPAHQLDRQARGQGLTQGARPRRIPKLRMVVP